VRAADGSFRVPLGLACTVGLTDLAAFLSSPKVAAPANTLTLLHLPEKVALRAEAADHLADPGLLLEPREMIPMKSLGMPGKRLSTIRAPAIELELVVPAPKLPSAF